MSDPCVVTHLRPAALPCHLLANGFLSDPRRLSRRARARRDRRAWLRLHRDARPRLLHRQQRLESPGSPPYSAASGGGDAAVNDAYLVLAVDADGLYSDRQPRVAEFDFDLIAP